MPCIVASMAARPFQPRALDLPGRQADGFNGHTVVRGAFTVSDYLEGTGTNLRLPINPPFSGGASAGEFQTQYLSQALPTTTASDGIIAAAPAGTACPTFTCYAQQYLPPVGPERSTCDRRSVEPDRFSTSSRNDTTLAGRIRGTARNTIT